MWIHEHQNWPDFTWDVETLASKLADIRYHQGRFLGQMEGLGFERHLYTEPRWRTEHELQTAGAG